MSRETLVIANRWRPWPAIAAVAAMAAMAACGPRAASTPPPAPDPGTYDGPADEPSAAEILAASDLPAPQPRPLPGDPLGVTIHRLSNGMTVYVSTDRAEPRISAWISVRTGSRNDPASSTGLAHYLEHMLFKGSGKLGTTDFEGERRHLDRIAELYAQLRAAGDDAAARSKILAAIDAETQRSARYAIPNEIDQLYAALGFRGVNAFTSEDETVYTVDLPRSRFAAWARVEGDRFTDPQFRLFYPELEAVYEEKNQSLDSPTSRVFEAMGAALFPRHPYGSQSTIGTIEHLKTPAYADMVAYYQRWYVPNNMAIILAGDIDAETALPVLEREFAALEPRGLPPPDSLPGTIEPLSGRTAVDVVAEGEDAVYLAWQTVGAGDPRRETWDVLDLLLDNATSGLLNVELVLSQKLPRAGAFGWHQREAGLYVVWGSAREGQRHDEVERLLLGVIGKLKRGELTQEDIDAVVVNREIDQKRELESNQARASAMNDAFIDRLPWPRAAGALDRLRAVTREDVIEAASRLGPNYVAVRRVSGKFEAPQIEKPRITPVKLDTARKSAFAAAIQAMEAPPIEPVWAVAGEHYQRLEGPAGQVIAAANPRSDLFEVVYEWDLGSRRQRLLCFAFDALETAGAKELGAAALQKKLYALGSSIGFSCDADRSSITVTGIERNLGATIALLRDWLGAPSFTKETLIKLAENIVSQRKDRLQEPAFVAAALSLYARLGAASPLLQELSSQAVTRQAATGGSQLPRALRALLASRHRIGYFGPSPKAELPRRLLLGARHRRVPPPPPRKFRQVRRPTIFFADKAATQAQVSATYPRPPLAASQRATARLYSEYIGGGMGALIFQELREARGLVYSARGAYSYGERPRDAAGLIAGLGTQADKTVVALSALTQLLGALEQPDPDRLATAKSSLLEEYRATRPLPRDLPALVMAWDDLGIASDPRPGYVKAIAAASAADLGAFAERAVDVAPVLAVTGDSRRIDLVALRKLGAVITVKPADLVSW